MNFLLENIEAVTRFNGNSTPISDLAVATLLVCSVVIACLLGRGSR
jgi:hypothetical protein